MSTGSRATAGGTLVWTPFYFVNYSSPADNTVAVALPQGAAASNVYAAAILATTHLYIQGVWDDCFTLNGPANIGYYLNGLSAFLKTYQPPFCFGTAIPTGTLAAQYTQVSAFTFIPTVVALKLTSTILLGIT